MVSMGGHSSVQLEDTGISFIAMTGLIFKCVCLCPIMWVDGVIVQHRQMQQEKYNQSIKQVLFEEWG